MNSFKKVPNTYILFVLRKIQSGNTEFWTEKGYGNNCYRAPSGIISKKSEHVILARGASAACSDCFGLKNQVAHYQLSLKHEIWQKNTKFYTSFSIKN